MRAHRRKTEARSRSRVRERHPEPVASRRCDRCHEEKPAGEFHRNRALASGLQSYCKACRQQYDAQPERRIKDRLRKHVWYLVHYERERRRRRRLFLDPAYRARVYAANLARYYADPKGVTARRRELRQERRALEASDGLRCWCGKALPEGKWFCRAVCKLKCSRFVCGLDAPDAYAA